MRYFNGKLLELLAPAGNFEIFKEIINSNCDAIYLGGKKLNMRMIRKGFNFEDHEIKEAINLAREKEKKVYITVNNLLNDEDINEAKEFLLFLAEVGPDALIIQDLAVVEIIRQLKLKFQLHASVMMNVHNLETIKALQEKGVSRVVLSREMAIGDMRYIKTKSDIEVEYFTHGDMCIAHGSQCYYSSILFGMSSNRGRCLKPCRWWFKIKHNGKKYDTKFPMAVKDMCMYPYLPEMIEAGVDSFKIEGRMREKEFITRLVNIYGDAIDRYIEDPLGFDRKKDYGELFETRKRDLSVAYAFGKPGLKNINTRGEGTGKFYSTGKMFSTPTEEEEISDFHIEKITGGSVNDSKKVPQTVGLSVRVNNIKQAKIAMEKGADRIYLSGDVYLPDMPFTMQEINEIIDLKKETEIYLGFPRMMNEMYFDQYHHFLSLYPLDIDGLLVSNLGAVKAFKKYQYNMSGDYPLNIYNDVTAKTYKGMGLSEITPSIELPYEDLYRLISKTENTELIVHGPLAAMYLEHDLYENLDAGFEWINDKYTPEREGILALSNEAGDFLVFKDQYGRGHVHTCKELCLMPVLGSLICSGVKMVRIEGAIYPPEVLGELIDVYKEALTDPQQCKKIFRKMKKYMGGFTLGSLRF